MAAAESVNNGLEDTDGQGGLRDFGSTTLTELDLDITGVERLNPRMRIVIGAEETR
ncbi:hypothetical protein [Mycetocola lacteus]|uniref:hypothetical protein n=1 Tax=Mycetocola lacteus TaxID=76637 RepID=UPI0016035866|nr:hypothetical protein [Mycetocola lacteus]